MHPRRYDPEVNPELVGKEETAQFSSDLTLMTISAYNYYYYATSCSDFFDEWRAVPMPRLSEDVPATYVEAEDTREKIDIVKLNAEIEEIVAREQILREKIAKIIAEIEVGV